MNIRLTARTLASAALLVAASGQAAPQIETPGFFITTVGSTVGDVAALENPYIGDGLFVGLQKVAAVAFAQKVDVVFAVEKAGMVRVIVDGETQALPVLDMRDQVSDWIDSGMGGVAVHPDFPTNPEILITYTHNAGVSPVADNQPKYARVARLKVRAEVDALGKTSYFADAPTEDDIIIGRLRETAEFPSCNDRPLGADCAPVDFAAHTFTFVHYGPDGKIYIGTGDGAGYFKPEPHALYAQVNKHLSGKVLRVNADGSGPEDNPFYTGNKWDNESKIFAKGLRNPKSGSFDPATGKLCVGNVGWFLKEGVYCLSPGDNAGWPCRENGPDVNGYQNLSLTRDGERLASCPLDPTAYIEPDFSYAHKLVEIGGELLPIGAVIGCTRPTAEEYPDNFKGTCVFGDYVFDTIETVSFDDTTVGNPSSSLILSGAGNPTDLTTDRNGRVCYVAYNAGVVDGTPVSEIRCIGYDNDGSVPLLPVASFTTSVPNAAVPAAISMNASSSYHPSGAELVYSWDFGDGQTAGNVVSVDHTYAKPGEYQVTLSVTAAGTDITRTTFQLVNVLDPDFITPVIPSVVDITYSDNDHEISSPVEFDVLVRNDLGTDSFRALANIYNEAGTEVGHLVLDELFVIAPGETETISFRWDQAGELGEHTVAIEFYAEDWESWTLKYPNQSTFFVRNRAAADAGVTDIGGTDGTADAGTAGTAGIMEDTDGGTSGGSVDAGGTDATGTTDTAGTADSTDPVGTVESSSKGLFGCSISSSDDPTFIAMLLAALMLMFTRKKPMGRRAMAKAARSA